MWPGGCGVGTPALGHSPGEERSLFKVTHFRVPRSWLRKLAPEGTFMLSAIMTSSHSNEEGNGSINFAFILWNALQH